MKNRLVIKISGPAGAGMMQAGETLSKALNRKGFYTLMYPEYPSRIRGGDNHIQVVFSTEKFLAPQEKIDLLLAFGKKNFEEHKKEGNENFVGFEGSEIGLDKIAEELGNPLVLNTAGLGFIWAVLGLELNILVEQLAEDFADKGTIRDLNIKAAKSGYEIGPTSPRLTRFRGGKEKIINLTGNEALVKGILAAETDFAAVYPMTPINEILRLLAKSKIKLFRPEDEIAGINAALGAAFAGGRAMVATSGGGFALMTEALGMAGMAEIPVVIVLGQRTGPSTGMATFSSQADLNFAISAGQGEFPRVVLAPGDLKEMYFLGAEAFNLAEKYQVPVILLTDKYLAESRFSTKTEELEEKIEINRGKLFEELGRIEKVGGYKRYEFTKDGISPRAFPGQTTFLTNSYEHDELGFSSDDSENRRKMMGKRMKKLEKLEEELGVHPEGSLRGGVEEFEGVKGWDKGTTLIGWGSTKEIILDVLKGFPEFNFIHFWRLWPFPQKATEILAKTKKLVVIEGNFSGQLADLIEKETGIKSKRILKDNGRPFFWEELKERIRSLK